MASLVDVLLGMTNAGSVAGQRTPLGDVGLRGGWQYDANPVGTSTTRPQQSVGAAGPIDPVVGNGLPVTRGQLRDIAQNAWQTAGAVSDGGLTGSGMMGGIKAYHGSPHSFDRFDLAKIGTGEGAQAYGHGLYFAGNEGVARGYRDALTPTLDHPDLVAARNAYNAAYNLPVAGSEAEFKAALARRDMAFAAMQEAKKLPPIKNAGHMYEVNLNTDPSRLLDWDRGATTAPVLDALKQIPELNRLAHPVESLTGADIYKGLEQSGRYSHPAYSQGLLPPANWQPNPAAASETLRSAGIPGIQYLDQGSRAAGAGSHNYVMFDPSMIEIMRKYAVPGMVAGGAAATPLMQAGQNAQ